MNKTIKPQNPALHGLSYSILLLVFTLLCLRKKPYNYHRCNLWLTISHFAVLWSLMLSSIFWISDYRSVLLWISIEYAGWAILLICGFFFQWRYCPSLLFSEKSLDISLFFRFSLGNSASEKTLIMDIVKKRNELKKEIKNYKEKQAP
ncbi:unnamed protein product [Blepharisma stoltei]|uniref:Uncharacterized protein n=1 Tax=Blepharisma stoltei TaxID=1481888 RepID=A0AAU9IFK2_9CILI|nr:unnamed protein product [Blepharisma stoltei]